MEGSAAAEGDPHAGAGPATVLVILVLGVALGALSAVLILLDLPVGAGVAVAGAGVALVLAGVWSRDLDSPRVAFADAALERVVDASILGSVAWVGLEVAPRLAAAALAALAASYLASYLRAKATGLGFPVGESTLVRAARWSVVAAGLVVPAILEVALWTATGISVAVLAGEVNSVARRREER